MTDRETIETILEFNLLISDLEGESVKRLRESLRKAIVALNEQEFNIIGKQVEFGGDCCDAGLIIDSAECPTCGYYYDLGDPGWGEQFCPHCGQKLLWEETTNDK